MKNILRAWLIGVSGILCSGAFAQSTNLKGIVKDAATEVPLAEVSVLLEESQNLEISDKNGQFTFSNLKKGTYHFIFFAEGYTTKVEELKINEQSNINWEIQLDSLQLNLEAIEVEAERRQSYGLRRLRNVEGMAIYAAKKSEVIELENLVANLATNNARQVYKGIAGLNVFACQSFAQ